VIALERLIPDSDLDYFIDFNYKKAGELQARAIVKKAPKGNYELVDGYPEDWKTEDLRKGQMKVLQPLIDCGDIQIEASKKGLPANDHKVTTAILTNSNINLMGSEPAESKKSDNVESQKLYIAGVGQNLMTCRRIVSGTQTMTVYAPPKKLAEETAYLAAKLARKATEFDCQFVEIPNGKKNVKAVLLTPLAVDAKNLDSTIIADQVQKKEDVYGK
jgi:D-xylose transport system substrate-binding protein